MFNLFQKLVSVITSIVSVLTFQNYNPTPTITPEPPNMSVEATFAPIPQIVTLPTPTPTSVPTAPIIAPRLSPTPPPPQYHSTGEYQVNRASSVDEMNIIIAKISQNRYSGSSDNYPNFPYSFKITELWELDDKDKDYATYRPEYRTLTNVTGVATYGSQAYGIKPNEHGIFTLTLTPVIKENDPDNELDNQLEPEIKLTIFGIKEVIYKLYK